MLCVCFWVVWALRYGIEASFWVYEVYEVAGQVERALPFGEYEDVTAWLSVSVYTCAIQRFF